MTKPEVIIIEGLDGVGKTTQAIKLAEALGVEYLKGGGWQKDSDLARRANRWGNRDRDFSLMQVRCVKDLKEKLKTSEGLVGVVDRFVLVDVAHILSQAWDEEEAAWSLAKFIPDGVWGIVLDVSDKAVIEERIRKRFSAPAERELISWLQGNDHGPEADTLERFEAKRAAWLWCAHKLGWEVVDGTGAEKEVFGRIQDVLEQRGIWPEGQVRFPEGRPG